MSSDPSSSVESGFAGDSTTQRQYEIPSTAKSRYGTDFGLNDMGLIHFNRACTPFLSLPTHSRPTSRSHRWTTFMAPTDFYILLPNSVAEEHTESHTRTNSRSKVPNKSAPDETHRDGPEQPQPNYK